MYCPNCLTEYREGFFECADCRVPLAPGFPPQLAPEPDSRAFGRPSRQSPYNGDIVLVNVLETNDPFGLSLATAALEDAGIEYLTPGGSARYEAGSAYTFGVGLSGFQKNPCRIQVAPEFAAEARTLLEPFQQPLSPAEIEAEPEADRPPHD